MNDASIYIRLSKEDNKDQLGIEVQRKLNQDYADKHNLTVVSEFIDDGVGGAEVNRPQLNAALEAAKAGKYQHLLMRSHKRFSRSAPRTAMYLEGQFLDLGINIHYVLDGGLLDPNDAGSFWSDIAHKWSANQERLNIARRSSTKRRVKAKSGVLMLTRRPFGYDIKYQSVEGTQELSINNKEAKIVKQIYEWAAKDESGAAIAEKLNSRGITKVSGKDWRGKDVLSLLRRELYRGIWLFQQTMKVDAEGKPTEGRAGKQIAIPRDQMTEVEVPAIVSSDDWQFVNTKIKSRTRRHRPDFMDDHQFLLRRRVFCQECGQVYHAQVMEAKTSSGTRPRDYLYYRHPATECPNKYTYKQEELELKVMDWIVNWVDNPEKDWHTILKTASGDDVQLQAQIAEVTALLDELDPERKRLIRMAAKAGITEAELANELERIENDRLILRADASELENRLSNEVFVNVSVGIQEGFYTESMASRLEAEHGERKNNWTFNEWLTKIKELDIEIEVDRDGGLWGSFAASPDVFSLATDDPDAVPQDETEPVALDDTKRDSKSLFVSSNLHLSCGYDRFNAHNLM